MGGLKTRKGDDEPETTGFSKAPATIQLPDELDAARVGVDLEPIGGRRVSRIVKESETRVLAMIMSGVFNRDSDQRFIILDDQGQKVLESVWCEDEYGPKIWALMRIRKWTYALRSN